ncbi:hypothetical protein RRG08_014216 [Elysia crispata]|uniref:Uncharacterized protein n=1 Tax=Elysia crispata TaxID=231223 RepID=A0AAE0XED8_9GAST|nr:hypothetical protein RRG08_014216 [Elysia crispata]
MRRAQRSAIRREVGGRRPGMAAHCWCIIVVYVNDCGVGNHPECILIDSTLPVLLSGNSRRGHFIIDAIWSRNLCFQNNTIRFNRPLYFEGSSHPRRKFINIRAFTRCRNIEFGKQRGDKRLYSRFSAERPARLTCAAESAWSGRVVQRAAPTTWTRTAGDELRYVGASTGVI